jgi:hypothetical protein
VNFAFSAEQEEVRQSVRRFLGLKSPVDEVRRVGCKLRMSPQSGPKMARRTVSGYVDNTRSSAIDGEMRRERRRRSRVVGKVLHPKCNRFDEPDPI